VPITASIQLSAYRPKFEFYDHHTAEKRETVANLAVVLIHASCRYCVHGRGHLKFQRFAIDDAIDAGRCT